MEFDPTYRGLSLFQSARKLTHTYLDTGVIGRENIISALKNEDSLLYTGQSLYKEATYLNREGGRFKKLELEWNKDLNM